MQSITSSSDNIFRASFEAGQIVPADFNHRGHLRLAYTYLCDGNTKFAYKKMKIAIRNLLKNNGVDESKYHETLTMAWIQAVRHFMEMSKGGAQSFDEFVKMDDRILNDKIMLSHYSKELLFSNTARARFVKPDLQAIPQY